MKLVNTTVPTKKTKKPVSKPIFYSGHVLLAFLFFGTGWALRLYETNSPTLGEFFYPATVVIGCIVGCVALLGEIFIEQKPPVWIKEKPRPKTWGVVLIIFLLCLTVVLLAAGVAASILWNPDMESHAGITSLFGCVPAFAAVCILRYLPHILPQKEANTKSP